MLTRIRKWGNVCPAGRYVPSASGTKGFSFLTRRLSILFGSLDQYSRSWTRWVNELRLWVDAATDLEPSSLMTNFAPWMPNFGCKCRLYDAILCIPLSSLVLCCRRGLLSCRHAAGLNWTSGKVDSVDDGCDVNASANRVDCSLFVSWQVLRMCCHVWCC